MEEKKGQRIKKKPTLLVALIPVVSLIVFLSYAVLMLEESPHVPLVMAAVVAGIVGISLGFTWKELEDAFLEAIHMSMQACLILIIVGALIGVWILSGTVPAMIYYGLQIIHPSVFLAVSCLVCAIVSLATGSSWTTAGTIGVALLGIGLGLGIPAPITCGAIISGAYFGDKMSPLSDTTNLAPAVAGSTLFDHIRHMVYTTGPSLIIALVIFAVIGFKYGGSELDLAQIDELLVSLNSNFNINIFLLIPPITVILMVVFKVPALPGLIGGTLLGALFFFIFQAGYFESMQDCIAAVVSVANDGYVADTGNLYVDDLLTNGGMQGMLWSVSIVFCSMTVGGMMEKSRCLEVIADALLAFAKNTGSLVTVTLLSCFFLNLVTGDQYLAIVIPGRMYKNEYRKRGLSPKNLSRCLEDCGTLTSPLIPWNSCGAYMFSVLGVSPLAYLPYCFLNIINPFVSIFMGFTGITMEKLPEEEMVKVRQEFEMGGALNA